MHVYIWRVFLTTYRQDQSSCTCSAIATAFRQTLAQPACKPWCSMAPFCWLLVSCTVCMDACALLSHCTKHCRDCPMLRVYVAPPVKWSNPSSLLAPQHTSQGPVVQATRAACLEAPVCCLMLKKQIIHRRGCMSWQGQCAHNTRDGCVRTRAHIVKCTTQRAGGSQRRVCALGTHGCSRGCGRQCRASHQTKHFRVPRVPQPEHHADRHREGVGVPGRLSLPVRADDQAAGMLRRCSHAACTSMCLCACACVCACVCLWHLPCVYARMTPAMCMLSASSMGVKTHSSRDMTSTESGSESVP
jgi:hypothetical protein